MGLIDIEREKEASRKFARKYVDGIQELSNSDREKMYNEMLPLLFDANEKDAEILKDYIFGDWRKSDKSLALWNETMGRIFEMKKKYISQAK
jgi:hypothetical protein